MNEIAQFFKVSKEQYIDSNKERNSICSVLCTELEDIKLPFRATYGSAGHDFFAPFSFKLHANETIKIPTGIRVQIDNGWTMIGMPKSGLGFKYRLQLDNTLGLIDEDYFFSDNEGHIFAKITNDGKQGKIIEISKGDPFMQAIFVPYGITKNDNDFPKQVRNGGMGSTSQPK